MFNPKGHICEQSPGHGVAGQSVHNDHVDVYDLMHSLISLALTTCGKARIVWQPSVSVFSVES